MAPWDLAKEFAPEIKNPSLRGPAVLGAMPAAMADRVRTSQDNLEKGFQRRNWHDFPARGVDASGARSALLKNETGTDSHRGVFNTVSNFADANKTTNFQALSSTDNTAAPAWQKHVSGGDPAKEDLAKLYMASQKKAPIAAPAANAAAAPAAGAPGDPGSGGANWGEMLSSPTAILLMSLIPAIMGGARGGMGGALGAGLGFAGGGLLGNQFARGMEWTPDGPDAWKYWLASAGAPLLLSLLGGKMLGNKGR